MLLNFIRLRLFTVIRGSFCTSYRSAISVEINYIFINIRDNSRFVGNCVASQTYSNREERKYNLCRFIISNRTYRYFVRSLFYCTLKVALN